MFWKRKDESKEEGGDSSLVNKSAEAQRYLKVVFVGSRGSGTKTSFIEKYSGTNGYPAYKEMTWLGKRLILELWDDSDGSTTDADAIVFGYDITSRKSYNVAMDYRQPLIEKNPDAVKMVIGNKLDLAEKRTVSTNEGRILADVVHAACFHEGIFPAFLSCFECFDF